MERSVTLDQILAWSPCPVYNRERITKLAAGRERFTAEDFAALPIEPADRLWCLLHEELIPARELRLLACDFVERAMRHTQWRFRATLEVTRQYARGGATAEEFQAAWALLADRMAALARQALREPARTMAWAASCQAVLAAAWTSPVNLEVSWQLQRALEVCRKGFEA